MSTKGEQTRRLILAAAEKLFARQGYQAVTMTDVCEACGLSRGGLYRHFGSTKALFIAILEADMRQGQSAVQRSLSTGVPAMVILNHYFAGEKAAMFGERNGLFFAIHEFAFCEADMREFFAERLCRAVEVIGNILEHGQKNGEFKALDVEAVANHILYCMDSMKTSSILFESTERMVEAQFELIREMLV